MTDIGKRLYETMQEKEVSYGRLEEKTGISKSIIYRYATGKTAKIPIPRLEALARALNVTTEYLLGWEEKESSLPIDDSDFNIIISNTQKIIVKKKRKETSAAETLFSGSGSLLSAVYGAGGDEEEDDAWDDTTLMDNQRFKKLCRLPQLGVYVDEAHHLFGADLEKQIRSSGANKTSLRDTINLLAANTSIVACYNYTGTPYVKNQRAKAKTNSASHNRFCGVLNKQEQAFDELTARGRVFVHPRRERARNDKTED